MVKEFKFGFEWQQKAEKLTIGSKSYNMEQFLALIQSLSPFQMMTTKYGCNNLTMDLLKSLNGKLVGIKSL